MHIVKVTRCKDCPLYGPNWDEEPWCNHPEGQFEIPYDYTYIDTPPANCPVRKDGIIIYHDKINI